jgi:hypothetical protein
MKTTREQILRDCFEMARHNLSCYSENGAWKASRSGCEEEYETAKQEIEILTAWLNEFPSTRLDATRRFVGHINGWSRRRNLYGQAYIEQVNFEVETGADYLNGDKRTFGINFHIGRKWMGGEDDPCGKYDREKDHRDSRYVVIEVNHINTIVSLDWRDSDKEE